MEIPVELLMIDERMFEGFITFKYLLSSSGKIEMDFTNSLKVFTFTLSSFQEECLLVFMLQCSCYNVHVREEECIPTGVTE